MKTSTRKTIVIVGTGQIGSRHLQALANAEYDVHIVDNSEESRNVAIERYNAVKLETSLCKIFSHPSLASVPSNIDAAIVATRADIRYQIAEELAMEHGCKFFMLEKVLFQKLSEYEKYEKLTAQLGLSTVVNFPRRMFTHYTDIRKQLKGRTGPFSMHVSGPSWGLACNGLHFLDLFEFLGQDAKIDLDFSRVDEKPVDSKRSGVIELNGTLIASNSIGDVCIIENQDSTDGVLRLSITDAKSSHMLFESGTPRQLTVSQETDWEVTSHPLDIKYQSELSHIQVEELLKGNSRLTPYSTSMHTHKAFLTGILKHINLDNDVEFQDQNCPIT